MENNNTDTMYLEKLYAIYNMECKSIDSFMNYKIENIIEQINFIITNGNIKTNISSTTKIYLDTDDNGHKCLFITVPFYDKRIVSSKLFMNQFRDMLLKRLFPKIDRDYCESFIFIDVDKDSLKMDSNSYPVTIRIYPSFFTDILNI